MAERQSTYIRPCRYCERPVEYHSMTGFVKCSDCTYRCNYDMAECRLSGIPKWGGLCKRHYEYCQTHPRQTFTCAWCGDQFVSRRKSAESCGKCPGKATPKSGPFTRTCKKCGQDVECATNRGVVPCRNCKPTCPIKDCTGIVRKYGVCQNHSYLRDPARSNGLPIRECEYCGDSFRPRVAGSTSCAKNECARTRARKTAIRSCAHCGTSFSPRYELARLCGGCRDLGGSLGPDADSVELTIARQKNDRDAIFTALRNRSKVTSDGCWLWQGAQNDQGYGMVGPVRGGSREVGTHRVSLEAKIGHPLGKMHSHHMCAVRLCCNPGHLQLATAAENVGEMFARRTYEARIEALESALREANPNHPLLGRREVA